MAMTVREVCQGKFVELSGEFSVIVDGFLLEDRFSYLFDKRLRQVTEGFEQLGSGPNLVYVNNFISDASGIINAVIKLGPRIMGDARILALSADACSPNSVVVRGTLNERALLPMAFVNRFPSVPCLTDNGDIINSPLLFENGSPVPGVSVDIKVQKALPALIDAIREDVASAAFSSATLKIKPIFGVLACFWCALACELAAKACIASSVGAAVLLCLAAEIACLAACNESHKTCFPFPGEVCDGKVVTDIVTEPIVPCQKVSGMDGDTKGKKS